MMENNIKEDSNTINEFLLQMSDDLIYMNIEEQIKNSNNLVENYFSFILNKLNGLKTILSVDDQELINQIDNFKDEVCDRVQELLQDKFKFTCDFKCYSDKSICLKEIYKFFVIRKREILLSLVNNFIDREYKSLLIKYSKCKINKKDVSYINNKKNIEKDDMLLLLNIHNIISSIELVNIEDTLELLIDDKDEFTYNFILTMFNQEEIIFSKDFMNVIKEELNNEKNYLIMESRINLLEKLKNNKGVE